ncbi:MAG: HNH endonuclease [Acidobacteriales bacterium]|nr:HNH endonuclease [Terriglobales bacterium]
MLAQLFAKLTGRSTRWPAVRRVYLAANPKCAGCGAAKSLSVHHVEPFHLKPELELEPSNLITLCEPWFGGQKCHLRIGHNNNWRDVNPHVRVDALTHLRLVEKMRRCEFCGAIKKAPAPTKGAG